MDIPALSNFSPVSALDEASGKAAGDAELHKAAEEFEAAFVRQMLQYAGLAEAFGVDGDASSDALSSFLLDHLATEIAGQGAFGLADTFYDKLAAEQAAADGTTGKRV